MKPHFVSLMCTAICVFFLAFCIQSFDLNAEGRTWDEQFKVDTGISALSNISSGRYTYTDWAYGIEHPPVAKYLYGAFYYPEIKKIRTNLPVSPEEYTYIQEGNYYAGMQGKTAVISPYDFTSPRLFSAFCNALTVSLVFITAVLLFNKIWIGTCCAIILLGLPRYIAMGRLMTYESISGVLVSLLFLCFLLTTKKKNIRLRWSIVYGLLLGLLLWTRYNNISIFFVFIGWVAIWVLEDLKNRYRWGIKTTFISFIIAGILGFIVWPFLWIEFPRGVFATIAAHHTRLIISSFYHLNSLLITTPVLFIILFCIGFCFIVRKRVKELDYVLWWFMGSCLFFTLFSSPTGGTRYIFTIYPSIVLIIGYGLKNIVPKNGALFIAMIFGLYSLFTLVFIHPYYLDYYNGLIGGVAGAEKKGGYEISWWGEGQREAGEWLKKNAIPNAKIALFVTPQFVFPRVRQDTIVFPYNTHIENADYIVVSRNDMTRFLKTPLQWEKVYVVSCQDVSLISVWKRKK